MPTHYIRKAAIDPIADLASRMEANLAKAFLKAVEAAKGTVNLERLTEAISKGDVNQALAILALDKTFTAAMQGGGLQANIQSVRDAIQETFLAGAKLAQQQLPEAVSVAMTFNMMNPQAVKFINDYTFDLIKDISASTKETIRQVLTRALEEGGHPYEQAREIRNVIGLTATQEKALNNYRVALESGPGGNMKDALDRALRDGRFDRSVLTAIQNQIPLKQAQIDKMVDRYRDRYLTYRAQTIARTETIRAATAGQTEVWRQAKEQGLMPKGTKRMWIASGDERTCVVCSDLDEEVAELDEEFDVGIMAPPDPHPDCRCGLALVFT